MIKVVVKRAISPISSLTGATGLPITVIEKRYRDGTIASLSIGAKANPTSIGKQPSVPFQWMKYPNITVSRCTKGPKARHSPNGDIFNTDTKLTWAQYIERYNRLHPPPPPPSGPAPSLPKSTAPTPAQSPLSPLNLSLNDSFHDVIGPAPGVHVADQSQAQWPEKSPIKRRHSVGDVSSPLLFNTQRIRQVPVVHHAVIDRERTSDAGSA
ncbi:hypothetical protein AX16_004351 [Volvariella volvacea WC 439]|nr:hypothetical protein AX16_004351 [Volvariella volvacea WC 439]